jgi:hypothetical protein
VSADCDKGVLKISLAKKAEAKSTQYWRGEGSRAKASGKAA